MNVPRTIAFYAMFIFAFKKGNGALFHFKDRIPFTLKIEIRNRM